MFHSIVNNQQPLVPRIDITTCDIHFMGAEYLWLYQDMHIDASERDYIYYAEWDSADYLNTATTQNDIST